LLLLPEIYCYYYLSIAVAYFIVFTFYCSRNLICEHITFSRNRQREKTAAAAAAAMNSQELKSRDGPIDEYNGQGGEDSFSPKSISSIAAGLFRDSDNAAGYNAVRDRYYPDRK